MISDRKRLILKTIIKEYTKTAQAISSGLLVEKYNLGISTATVRNEMMELEDDGYIFQPHTSAGRIPTELAYALCVAEFIDEKKVSKGADDYAKILDKVFAKEEDAFKQTAKAIAELSGNAVFWAFHKNNLYYTGISNLFAQEEFKQLNMIHDASGVIDRLDEIIDQIFNDLVLGRQIYIGSSNPFGNFLSTILLKYNYKNQSGVFGILGPMRMDYEKNLALIEYIKNKFK
ncbi:MAG: hypothetical protein WCK37_00455 [Candidatus Falkowbacteria bacterium]